MSKLIEIIFIISLIIVLLANLLMIKLRKDLKKEENKTGLSGFEIAKKISSKVALEEPHIIKKKGNFLDHYNSNRNVIKLSPEIFDGTDMYAALIALMVALETNKKRQSAVIKNNISNFLVIASYILIILGAFINKNNIIYFGFVIFIIAFIIPILFYNVYGKNKEEIATTIKLIEEEKIIKPFTEEEKNNAIIVSIMIIARLPYGFINNFR